MIHGQKNIKLCSYTNDQILSELMSSWY